MRGMKWVATGDMNATVGQLRWDYEDSGRFGVTDRAMEKWVEDSGGVRVENAQPTWWSKQAAAHSVLDHVIVKGGGGDFNIVVRNSWEPRHDHGVVYVFGSTDFLPGRPAKRKREPLPRRPNLKKFKEKQVIWEMVREPAMEGMLGEEIYELPPAKFQDHCFRACERLVDVAIEVAGRTGGESNRPPYRTKEVTKMVKEARVLEAAKREAYIMKKTGGGNEVSDKAGVERDGQW
jgi:hypothetical protein